jgi:hypothetical protein
MLTVAFTAIACGAAAPDLQPARAAALEDVADIWIIQSELLDTLLGDVVDENSAIRNQQEVRSIVRELGASVKALGDLTGDDTKYVESLYGEDLTITNTTIEDHRIRLSLDGGIGPLIPELLRTLPDFPG